MLVALVVFKRWRHLFTLLASIVVIELIASIMYDGVRAPRPYDVTILGRWAGFSLPAPPVMLLAIVGDGHHLHARGRGAAPHRSRRSPPPW